MNVLRGSFMLTNRCLWCNQCVYQNKNIIDVFFDNDGLCRQCRMLLKPQWIKFKVDKYEALAIYEYNQEFASMIFQFKQMYDASLYRIFLPKNKLRLYKYINTRDLLLVPSDIDTLKERGFYPLRLMAKQLHCIKKEPFIKYSKQQKKTSLSQRQQVKIGLKDDVKLNKRVVLIDDVCASKSTLFACIKQLETIGITDIKILVFAYERAR